MNIAFAIKLSYRGYWGYSAKPLPLYKAKLFETVSMASKKINELKQRQPDIEKAEIVTVTVI
jgi:hypothetical protein